MLVSYCTKLGILRMSCYCSSQTFVERSELHFGIFVHVQHALQDYLTSVSVLHAYRRSVLFIVTIFIFLSYLAACSLFRATKQRHSMPHPRDFFIHRK